jgi:hypothetical protein
MSFFKEPVVHFPTGKHIWPKLPAYLDRQESDIEHISFFDYVTYKLVDHQAGDWGIVDEETKLANAHALEHGGPLVSRHLCASDPDIVVEFITEANRSATRIILHKGLSCPR